MKVLVACEYSGVVRDAFQAKGHRAMSCDLLPSETEGNHYQGSVLDILDQNWDLMIAYPPDMLVKELLNAPIPKIALVLNTGLWLKGLPQLTIDTVAEMTEQWG